MTSANISGVPLSSLWPLVHCLCIGLANYTWLCVTAQWRVTWLLWDGHVCVCRSFRCRGAMCCSLAAVINAFSHLTVLWCGCFFFLGMLGFSMVARAQPKCDLRWEQAFGWLWPLVWLVANSWWTRNGYSLDGLGFRYKHGTVEWMDWDSGKTGMILQRGKRDMFCFWNTYSMSDQQSEIKWGQEGFFRWA